MTTIPPVAADGPNRFRPGVPPPAPARWREIGAVAVVLALLVASMLGPLWADPAGRLLGDPDTDAIRGMWGLDHVRRSMVPPDTPLWSGEVNFPHGVLAVVLPFASATLAAPLGALFGPVVGYNLTIAALLWAAGLGAAALGRQASGSWAAGLVAGAAVASQPMLLYAVADGTPEHVAVWGIAAFLALTAHAVNRRAPAWGAAAGLAAVVVALDGPYNAIYAALLAGILVPVGVWRAGRSKAGWTGLAPTLAALVAVAGVGAAGIALVYGNFTLVETAELEQARLLQMNAADLHSWWQFDFGPDEQRDPSLAPTLIPTWVLVGCVALGLLGLGRSGPWLAAGLLTLCLSFGWNAYLPKELAQWLGGFGQWLGNWVLTINVRAYGLPGIEGIRFPRRFLVPSALCFAVAGSAGLGVIFRWMGRRGRGGRAATWALALALSGASVVAGVYSGRLQSDLPMQELPPATFAVWLAAQEADGAVLTLPQVRAAPRSGKRADLPVFANLGSSLSGADTQYLQVLHGRPVVGYPSLKTLVPMRINTDIYKLTRSWDDLAHPLSTGNPIPRSAYDESSEPRRQATIAWLRQQGLRYIVVDVGVYAGEGMDLLTRQLHPHTQAVHDFEDGDGVRILELIER